MGKTVNKAVLAGMLFLLAFRAQPQEEKAGVADPTLTNKASLIQWVEAAPPHPLLMNYDVTHYHIDIEVHPYDVYVRGNTTIQAAVKEQPMDTFLVDLIDEMQVDSVLFNRRSLSFKHKDDHLIVPLPDPHPVDEAFFVQVFYEGFSQGGGLTTGFNSEYGKNVTWSLSESFHAREWFPCKQVLGDKADSARISLTTSEPYRAVSNGLLSRVEKLPDDKQTFHWVTRYPIAYYLLSFAVADFQEYSFRASLGEGSDSVLVQNFIYDDPQYLERWKSDIDRTDEMLTLFSEKWGPYPFREEKYGHSLMERGGGMEHQTLTTLSNFSFLLVAHELAHQWFGDYLTCGSWQDIWINEGFASYGEYMALEHLTSSMDPRAWMEHAHGRVLNNPDGSVYIPFSNAFDENRIFNYALSYKKGAALVHMIRYLIDDDNLFYQLLRAFLSQYQNDVATGEDLMNFLERQTQLDFTAFFDQWYYGKGFPTYNLSWDQRQDSLIVVMEQTPSAGDPSLFTTPVEIGVYGSGGRDTLLKVSPRNAKERWAWDYPCQVDSMAVDPNGWIPDAPGQVTAVRDLRTPAMEVKIYPNPVRDELHVDLKGAPPESEKRLYIKDIKGQVVMQKDFRKNSLVLNTQGLDPGVFIIEVKHDARYAHGKLIKL